MNLVAPSGEYGGSEQTGVLDANPSRRRPTSRGGRPLLMEHERTFYLATSGAVRYFLSSILAIEPVDSQELQTISIAFCRGVLAAMLAIPGVPAPAPQSDWPVSDAVDGATNGYLSGLGGRGSHGGRSQQNSFPSGSAMIQCDSSGSFST